MNDYFATKAAKEHYGYVELPARRGEIKIRDFHSGEEFLLATNTTLELLYADPTLVKSPDSATELLAPLIYNPQKARDEDNKRIEEAAKRLPADIKEEEKEKLLKPLTDEELLTNFKKDLLTKISAKKRPEITLEENLEQKQIDEVNAFRLDGIEVKGTTLYAYPPKILNTAAAAEHLAPIIAMPTKQLEKILKGENRYTVISRKLDPEISNKIHDLMKKDKEEKLSGIGLQEEYFRYYPENNLASTAIGFVDNEGNGQYGIESAFNTELQGKKGVFQTQKDSIGRQVISGDSVIEPAIDGDDVVLSIDRSIQLQLEKTIAADYKTFQADDAAAIVIDPKTGFIIALASAPNFNPNSYGDVYKKVFVSLTPEEISQLVPTKNSDTFMFYRNKDTYDFYYIFEQTNEQGQKEYYRYENFVGPEAYQNKAVALPYEPGSVFKPLIMAMALDDNDVKPNSTFNDSGPIGVDWNRHKNDFDYYIHNSTSNYFGPGTTMTKVLEQSLNTGMTYVAKTIGAALMYNYIEKFGFGQRTDIEFANESPGKIAYYDLWTESELATHAFGQGLTVNLIQLANAYSALANGGILMQPHIVKEIIHKDGSKEPTEPREIRRVISEETSKKITAMLTSVVENGQGKNGMVKNHFVTGKSGTAQTYKHGEPLTGRGTTVVTFCGYGPIDDPKFVVCIKMSHPRTSLWCADTVAYTFSKIATYLFDYYNIPPDKKY